MKQVLIKIRNKIRWHWIRFREDLFARTYWFTRRISTNWRVYNKGSEPKPQKYQHRTYFNHVTTDGQLIQLVMILDK